MADSSTTGNISLDCDFFGNFCKCVRNLSGCATDLKFEDQFNKVYACVKGPVFEKLFSNKWVIGAVKVIIVIVSAICWIVKGTAGNEKRWIENERNLLSSLEDDVKDVLDSGSPIYNEALTLWQTEEHNQEERARLKDSEEEWREKNETLVGKVDSLFRKINFNKKIFRSDDLVFLTCKNEIQEVKSKLVKHQNDSKAMKIDIYGTVDKLRPKIRILQDRPIDVGRKAEVKPVDKGIIDVLGGIQKVVQLIPDVRKVDNIIGELLAEVDEKNNYNLDDIKGEIQLFTLHLALVRAFLTDLRTFGSETETETEKIWLEEAKNIVDEVQQAIENFKKNGAKGRAEEAPQATENSKQEPTNDQTVDELQQATKEIVEEAPQATENSKQEPANDQTVDEQQKATKGIVDEAQEATENSKQEPTNDQTVDERKKATKEIVEATENSKQEPANDQIVDKQQKAIKKSNPEPERSWIISKFSNARSELTKEMKRINARFSELLERKKRFNVQFTRSFASREKDTSKSSGSENSQGQASEVRTSDDNNDIVLDEKKLINKYVITPKESDEKLKRLCDRFNNVNNTIKHAKDKEAIKSSTKERLKQMKKLAGKTEKYLELFQKNFTDESSIIDKYWAWEKLHKNFEQIMGALNILELTTEAYSIGIREEMRVVGLDDDIEDVVSDLKSGEFHVVWIVGMKGIGKTTLAKNIYDDDRTVRHFPKRAWVTLKEEENGGGDLVKEVCDILKKEKCLVVIDNFTAKNEDVWKTLNLDNFTAKNEDVRKTLNVAFQIGSRILLTTRDQYCVARTVGQPSKPHYLRLRTKEESWRLFIQMVDDFESAADDVKKLAEETVGRCAGLPLQILHYGYLILMSGIDVKDPKLLQWLERFKIPTQKPWLDSLKNEGPIKLKDLLQSQEKEIKDCPQQHKGDPPDHEDRICCKIWKTLKGCPLGECDLIKFFSFFNLFPRDYEIPARRLVALFNAVRSVKEGDEEKNKELVQHYLEALTRLNLIQAVEMNINGKVKKCRLPSALKDRFVFEIVSDKHLADNCHGTGTYSSDLEIKYEDLISYLSFDTSEGHKPGEEVGKFLQKKIASGCFRSLGIASGCFRSLKVLDLEHVFRPQLPNTIGKLFHLMYLGLRWTYLEEIPSSIGDLLNLQTLDLKHTYVRILPKSIWKLQKLRHLYLSQSHRSKFESQPKASSLNNLETLWGLFLDDVSAIKNGLNKLTNLTKLGLTFELELPKQDTVKNWVTGLTNLKSLRLRSIDEKGDAQNLRVMDLSNLENLSSLYLFGSFGKRHYPFNNHPPHLSDLTLSASGLVDDPMPILGNLPDLKSLCFYSGSYKEKKMVCLGKGFPELLVLKLWKLESLEELQVEAEAMPKLKELDIRCCNKLKVPTGLKHLNSLQELKLTNMPKDFTTIQEKKWEIWGDIAYPPRITVENW